MTEADIVELMARAIAIDNSPAVRIRSLALMQIGLNALKSHGLDILPVEPTEVMIRATQRTKGVLNRDNPIVHAVSRADWKAMVAACLKEREGA